ncbi:MAG TPA: metallophosphoesterase [Balneolaceae bacterium]|nr:metallophosphoesterase [Balneolaceae bacterium]
MSHHFSASSKILFLSDVHLGAFSDAKDHQLEDNLIGLLDFAESRNYQIAILGDLFDYWIEYPGKIPSLGKRTLRRFKKFNRHSTPLYITGNHDNWTLGHFSDLGFDVERNYRTLELGNKSVGLLHGDATGPGLDQLQRPFFHRLIRNEIFLKIYRRLLSPEMGLWVMKKFSTFTRSWDEEGLDPRELDHWADMILRNSPVNYLLCGHDHVQRIRNFESGKYINTGAFHHNGSLARYNNGDFSLVQWNSKTGELISSENQARTL